MGKCYSSSCDSDKKSFVCELPPSYEDDCVTAFVILIGQPPTSRQLKKIVKKITALWSQFIQQTKIDT
ncbi:hypothetical protein L3Y34_019499 [Caenorhabditis briggsae]|uniref:Uncharacterized protein n=1 Tax=Caenorhabditis briggsae TaxID=6238 RepID=A0AAE9DR03_CAEBR|nr:hypothetical protein L3Y34_019499 [Caenorhabditis briggsae]